MASGHAWKPSGDAKFSPVVARRGASVSPCSSLRSTPAPDSQAFPRAQRLTRGRELERIRLEGKRLRSASMEARVAASLLSFPRVGFVVPRYRQTAVARNRLKRRLREIVRKELLPMLPPLDLVLRVAPHAYQRDFAALQREVGQLARQLVHLRLPDDRQASLTVPAPDSPESTR